MNNKNFMHRRSITRWAIFAVIILCLCFLQIFVLLVKPTSRIGPFGLGIPTKMVSFQTSNLPFVIDYPESWMAFETPGGNRGDAKVVATISVPGRSLPFVSIASKQFSNATIEHVVDWGTQRAKAIVVRNKGYDFTEIDAGEIYTSRGMRGQYWIYSWKVRTIIKEYVYQCADSYFTRESTGLVIRQCSEQKDWAAVQEVFQDMVKSSDYREVP